MCRRKRCCTCYDIVRVIERHYPMGHVACECKHKNYSSHDSRVGKILSQTAEKLLYDYDSNECADSSLPIRHCHREIERQKHTGHKCRNVLCGIWSFHYKIAKPFPYECRYHAEACEHERTSAENIGRHCKCRAKRHKHMGHHLRGRNIIPYLR